jgi:serine/threonine protein kinase
VTDEPSEPSYGRLGPGSRVAGYVIEEKIGSGGMAVVFRARDESPPRMVALKVLSPALADDEAFRARFLRESRAVAKVEEPHIIPVYKAGEDHGVLYIATRFVAGGDLRKLLGDEGGRLAPDRASALITQVAAALEAAHAAGLVHRDVKPANVLIDKAEGRPEHAYLSDFGVSKSITTTTTGTSSGAFLGTPDYCAPEQFTGMPPVSARTDQYALACVAFHLLTGRVPYQRDSAIATLYAHLNAPVPAARAIAPELPKFVDPVLAKALSKKPHDRYESCGQFAAALAKALEPTAPKSPRPPRRGSRRIAAIAATVVAVAALVIVAVFIPHDADSKPTPAPLSTLKPIPGCSAEFGGLKDNEPIGFVTSKCFPGDSAMAAVASAIESQNVIAAKSGKPYRTVVFFGVMTSSTSGTANPASLFQLQGILRAQQQQNKKSSQYMIRVLLANAADEFDAGPTVAGQIVQRAHADHTIVAVLGIGQSRTYALSAIKTLATADLPVIGTSVTGDLMSYPGFFRISPSDARQAQLGAAFAKDVLKAHRVLVLANENNYIAGPNQDLYSDDLAAQFESYFKDSSHQIIDECDYGEQAPVTIHCDDDKADEGRSLSISQLRDLICQEKPDLIFFAGRANTLPYLFTTPGGTCHQLPAVLGSSDVPKYLESSDLQKVIPEYKSKLYYLSFAPAKETGCATHLKPYQTDAMCAFLSYYRGAYPNGSTDPDDDAGLNFDSSDAMLGYDALQTIIQAVKVSRNPGIDGAGILGELNSDRVSFDGATGLISFSSDNAAPLYHPVYVTLVGTQANNWTLTLQKSCGQYSSSSSQEDGYCPTVP